jgi:peptidoglycan/xylan/chitin deacetylase (PgdA/CDA1 family)
MGRAVQDGADPPFSLTGEKQYFENSPGILFTFDDGLKTIISEAYPILAAAGYRATAYITSDNIGFSESWMSAADLTTLYAAGWDIGNHTKDHTDLTTLTLEQQEAELSACATVLDGLGFTRSSHHVAIPYGPYNQDTLTALDNTEMITSRTVSTDTGKVPYPDYHQIKGVRYLTHTIPLDTAEGYINAATNNEVIIFYCHDITDEGGVGKWTTADFQSLVDFVAFRNLRVMTISELYALSMGTIT